MPVETRAQIRAREEAEKGPAGSVGSRATKKTTTATTTDAEPAVPKKKKAPAAKKAKAAPPAKRNTGTASRKKRMSVDGPLDTIVVDLVRSLPLPSVEEGAAVAAAKAKPAAEKKEKAAKEKVAKEKKEPKPAAAAPLPAEVLAAAAGSKRYVAIAPKPAPGAPPASAPAPVTFSAPPQVPVPATTTPPVATEEGSPLPKGPQAPAGKTAHDDSVTEEETENDDDGRPDPIVFKIIPKAAGPAPENSQNPPASLQPQPKEYDDAYPDMPPYDRAEKISGYVVYRTDYSHSQQEWSRYKEILMHHFRSQEAKAGKDAALLEVVWVEDEDLYGGEDLEAVREEFDNWCREKNPELDLHGEDSHFNYFPAGPYQDYTSNFCLVADKQSITSTLAPQAATATTPPSILILQRGYNSEDHEDEIADTPSYALIPENPLDAFDPSQHPAGFDPRTLVEEAVAESEKVVWAGYRGWFRAGMDNWMHLEPEAQGSLEFWMQYFAANAARSRGGCWTLLEGGVLEST
ncbi:hypothetical protein DFH27DRAFT_560435 [Peziza echinospora]|nr:hypothetical protein DFH27DRAFT_560435 [Peziza echinospora]